MKHHEFAIHFSCIAAHFDVWLLTTLLSCDSPSFALIYYHSSEIQPSISKFPKSISVIFQVFIVLSILPLLFFSRSSESAVVLLLMLLRFSLIHLLQLILFKILSLPLFVLILSSFSMIDSLSLIIHART